MCSRFSNDLEGAQARLLGATIRAFASSMCIFRMAHSCGSDKYRFKLEWMRVCALLLDEPMRRMQKVLLSAISTSRRKNATCMTRNNAEGRILFSKRERAALMRLKIGASLGLPATRTRRGISPGGLPAGSFRRKRRLANRPCLDFAKAGGAL